MGPDCFEGHIFHPVACLSARYFETIHISVYGEYNPATLNEILRDYPTLPGYLLATLAAYNATAPLRVDISTSDGQGIPNEGGGAVYLARRPLSRREGYCAVH